MAPCRTVADDGTCTFSCAPCAYQFGHILEPPIPLETIKTFQPITDEKASYMVFRHCESLRQDIRTALVQHGNSIATRWKKKSKSKRAAMILQVDSTLEIQPDYETELIYESDQDFARRRAKWDADSEGFSNKKVFRCFALPFLNVETLQDDPMRLLSLLHHRSSSSLEDWVSYDMSRLHDFYRRSGTPLPGGYNKSCVVMRGVHIGRLAEYDQERCHRLEMIGFPTALNIFKMQQELLLFLSSMVRGIIGPDDVPSGNDRWLSLLANGFKLSGSVECWSQFANPFARPPRFELMPCIKQVRAHLAEAEDHLKLLQTTPEFFLSVPEVRDEAALFKAVERDFGESFTKEMVGGVAVDTLTKAMDKVLHLRWLVKQCEFILEAWVSDKLSTSYASVTSYDKALSGLYHLAKQLCSSSKHDLGELLWASSEFSFGYAVYRGKDDPNIALKMYKEFFHKDRLHWLLYQIYTTNPYDNSTKDASVFASIEEHLDKAGHKERSRVSSGMYRHLSTTAIYQQIQTNIALSRPEIVWGRIEGTFHADLAADRTPGPQQKAWTMLSTLRSNIKSLRAHPWPRGKRDQIWLAKADETRKRMSSFWDNARKMTRMTMVSGGYPEPIISETLSCLDFDHAPEHLMEVEAERARILRSKTENRESTVPPTVAVPIQTVWGESDQEIQIELAVDRIKPKTRPALTVLHNQSNRDGERNGATNEALPEEPTTKIAVNAESIRIFSKLFATGDEPTKGIVKWQQVVTALCDAGLVGTNVGGSAVSFRLLSEPKKGVIVFHKPHPEPNIDVIHQRNMGKRLRKWFGWTAETFVERKKPTEKKEVADQEKTVQVED